MPKKEIFISWEKLYNSFSIMPSDIENVIEVFGGFATIQQKCMNEFVNRLDSVSSPKTQNEVLSLICNDNKIANAFCLSVDVENVNIIIDLKDYIKTNHIKSIQSALNYIISYGYINAFNAFFTIWNIDPNALIGTKNFRGDALVVDRTELRCAPITIASMAGQVEMMKHLINNYNVNVNILSSNGESSLTYAAQNGDFNSVKCLVKAGADVNITNSHKDTPITLALLIEHSHHTQQLEVIKYLIQHNANALMINKNGCDAPMIAATRNNLKVLKYFIEEAKIIDINHTAQKTKFSILMMAAQNGYFEMVKYIVEQEGCNINQQDSVGENATMVSARSVAAEQEWCNTHHHQNYSGENATMGGMCSMHHNFEEILQYLIDHGGDIHAKNHSQQNIINELANANEFDILRKLAKKYHLDIYNKDKDGTIPLMSLCKNGNLKAAKYFIEKKGVPVNITDYHSKTLLMYSAESKNLDIVKYLIAKCGGLHDEDNEGYSAVIYAIKHGNIEMMGYFIARGINIDFCNSNNISLLMFASLFGKKNVVECLMSYDADVMIEDKHHNNVMTYAIKSGNVEIVKCLIEEYNLGINFCCNSAKKTTPLMVAIENAEHKIIRYLIHKDVYSILQTNYLEENCIDIARQNGDYETQELFINELAKHKIEVVEVDDTFVGVPLG